MKGRFVVVLMLLLQTLVASAQNNIPQLEPLYKGGAKVVPDGWKMENFDVSAIQNKYLSIPYGSNSPTQTLDIYLPATGNGPFPVIVAIHGGGFSMGNSRMLPDVGPMLEAVKRGYALVSVNYRLSGEALFPRAVNDVKAAVRFVKANASTYKLDPNRIAVWGGSAGGNLAAMVGTTGNVGYLNGDNKENLSYSSNVQVVIDWFGPCDLTKFDEQFKAAGFKEHNSSVAEDSHESWYIGQGVLKDVAYTQKANPASYIETLNPQTSPVFLIQHGTLDPVVPLQQSLDFSAKLKEKLGDAKVTVKLIEGAHHFSPEFSSPENLDFVFKFLDSKLKQ